MLFLRGVPPDCTKRNAVVFNVFLFLIFALITNLTYSGQSVVRASVSPPGSCLLFLP